MRPPARAPSTREREEGEDNQAATGAGRTGPTADPDGEGKTGAQGTAAKEREDDCQGEREGHSQTAQEPAWPQPCPYLGEKPPCP